MIGTWQNEATNFGVFSIWQPEKGGATSMANPLYQDPYLEDDLAKYWTQPPALSCDTGVMDIVTWHSDGHVTWQAGEQECATLEHILRNGNSALVSLSTALDLWLDIDFKTKF